MKLPPYFSTNIKNHVKSLIDRKETPFLVIDLNVITDRYKELQNGLKQADIYYAVKANPADDVIQHLAELGSNFDLASVNELKKVLKFGVAPSRLTFGNTIKKSKDIKYFYDHGIKTFVTDSEADLRNIAKNAPTSKVFFRLSIDGSETADWPLSGKFGGDANSVIRLALLAKELNLIPYGISFHVGSQQREIDSWRKAINEAKKVFDDLNENHDINLSMLNLGGGLPANYRQSTKKFDEYALKINEFLKVFEENRLEKIMIEPGRSLVADAGILVSEIILVTNREKNQRWIYTDVGVFNGLIETIGEAIEYNVLSDKMGPTDAAIIAGPTCDSMDIMYKDKSYLLPLSLGIGDHLYWLSTGAYSTSYSSVEFNGFEPLNYYIVR